MTDYPLDIIIPVWNRPIEVRSALASFVSDSPMARLIMVNNGSERETESILDEFAEALDDRALLVASEKNIGSVAALNVGLAKSTAPLILIATPYTRVGAGWFEPVAAFFKRNTDVGSLVLTNSTSSASSVEIEADHGSFDAMILNSSLNSLVGGFDESMDGAEWALRDYARRSLSFGYRTVSLYSRYLTLLDYRELGSAARREEKVRLARERYISRWGAPKTYLLNISESFFGVDIDILKRALLESARQGDRLFVSAENRVSGILLKNGFSAIHENITFHPLPRFLSRRSLGRFAELASNADSSTTIISETEVPGSDMKTTSFPDFLSLLQKRNDLYYRKGNS